MPGVHLDQMLRFCGAKTFATGQSSFFVNNLKAAVEGDLNDHNNLGALISQSPGNFYIEGKKMIVSMLDGSAPDQIGTIIHSTNLPTPSQGSTNFFAYGGGSQSGGGLGSAGGLMQIGENALLNGNIAGVVNKIVSQTGFKLLVLSNLQGTLPTAGSTVVGQTTGNSFTFSSFQTG